MATVNLATASPTANDFAHLVIALADVRNCLLVQISDFLASSCQEAAGRPTGAQMADLDYPYGCELRDRLNQVDAALSPYLHLMPAADFQLVMAGADAERIGDAA